MPAVIPDAAFPESDRLIVEDFTPEGLLHLRIVSDAAGFGGVVALDRDGLEALALAVIQRLRRTTDIPPAAHAHTEH